MKEIIQFKIKSRRSEVSPCISEDVTLVRRLTKLTVDTSQLGLGLAPGGERAVLGDVLHVDSVVLQGAGLLHLWVLLPGPLAEAPVLANEDLLTAGELELGAPQSLNNLVLNKQNVDICKL